MNKYVFGLMGAGGCGREVMPYTRKSVSLALSVKEEDIDVFFLETGRPRVDSVNGYPLCSLDEFLKLDADKYFNVAVGNGRDRKVLADMIGVLATPLSIFAPDVLIFHNNQIGTGAVLCPRSMITSNAKIGSYFQGNVYSYVAHDCIIGDYVTFGPGVRCNGRVHIDDFAYIGANAVIREGTLERPTRIGRGAVVGMGAVVTKDIPEGVTVVGNPARILLK